MKGTKASIRYAQSLLDLSLEKGNLDQVANDMKHMHETTQANPELALFFKSPIVAGEKKISVIKEVFGAFEAMTMSFVQLVTKNGRESLLPQIAEAFGGLVKAHKGIVPVELVSAVKLDDATRKNILTKIEGSIEGTLEVTETVDESIIGGFVVKMGDRRIDASVKSQFNKLKQSLTN